MSEAKKGFQTTFIVKRVLLINKAKEGNFVFTPEVRIAFNKLSERQWETSVNIKVFDKEEQPFPFDMDIIVSLITSFPEEFPDNFNLKEYLKINSLNILFPYVRSVVTNVTSAALVNPIFLPLVDIVKMAEGINIPELE